MSSKYNFLELRFFYLVFVLAVADRTFVSAYMVFGLRWPGIFIILSAPPGL
jgi:hypothetical protein